MENKKNESGKAKGMYIHSFINRRVFITQNRDEFNLLSEKYKESKILYRQFINYSLPKDELLAKL